MSELNKILAKLAEMEGTSELIESLKKQIEIINNKTIGIEEKNKEIQDLKSRIENLDTQIKSKDDEIETLKTKGASESDGFKTLYETKKSKVESLEKELVEYKAQHEEFKKMKETQEAKFTEEIEVLYKQIPEDKKDFVKNMAEKYPLEERISFITDFLENFGITNIKKSMGGKIKSGTIESEMEDARKMFEEISKKPAHSRTDKEKRDFITLGKILDGKISLS